MIARAWLVAALTLFSFSASGASHLVAGAELPAGPYERQVSSPTYDSSAMATDGDRILAVSYFERAIQGTLIDRNGRVLNAEPIAILTRTETTGASDNTPLRVVWFRDRYIVLFTDVKSALNAVRVTADGKVVDRTVLPSEYWGQFDAATDGNEIVIVNAGSKLLRLDADLQLNDTLELPRLAWPAKTRAVTFGAGRFVIVTVESLAVTSQSLEHGTLGPLVKVAPVTVGWSAIARAAFTGSTFAAAWTECDYDYDRSTTDCIGAWTPLAPDGKAAGPVRVLGYNHLRQSSGYDYEFTMTALDEATLFFAWRGDEPQVAAGRKYRITGAAMGDAASFGPGPLTALRTGTGALAVLDSRQMLTWIDSAATASIPGTASATPALLRSPVETIVDAAASANEVGVLRKVYRSDGTVAAEVSFLARDGSLLRSVRLAPAIVLAGALASDGSDFFALTTEPYPSGRLTFHDVRRGTQKVLTGADTYDALKMVWNGAELIATWRERGQLILARLDREGRILGREPFDASEVLALTADADRILLVDVPKITGIVRSQLFDAHLRSLGPPETFPDTNAWYGADVATNGETDVLAMIHAHLDGMTVAFRPRNGTFVPGPELPNLRAQVSGPALAAGEDGSFFIAWGLSNPVLATTSVAVLDRQGFASRPISFLTGYSRPRKLIPLDDKHVLFVYARVAEEPRYGGVSRVFTRVLTIEEDTPPVVRGAQRQ